MTIKDIARLAGVSVTTVSMVLNNKDKSISDETREKVLRIVKEYNFKTYAGVLQNSSRRSMLVGLLVPENAGCYSEYVSGVEEIASAEGYSLVLCTTKREGAEISKHLANLQNKNADGIALYLAHKMDTEDFSGFTPKKAEIVVSSGCASNQKCSDVFFSYAEAARVATEYLLEFEHKQIALLGFGQADYLFEDLLSGYSDALYRHEIALRNELVCVCDGLQGLAGSLQKMLYGKVSAFLCADNAIAMCVYRELSRFGLQIPKDYSVVSLSAKDENAGMFSPVLTCVDMQYREAGRCAMRKLIVAMEGSEEGNGEAQAMKPKLQSGASVAPPLAHKGKRIVVVGSINMDVIIHTAHIPTSGESLIAQKIVNLPGGKGANQAVGAAKLGGDVCVIGCLGGDQEGRLLYSSLDENGVNVAGVQTLHDKPTGKAYILVAQDGESTIVISHGTNKELKPALIENNKDQFLNAEFCLISTEIPWETVEHTIDLCAQNNVKIILKPTMQEKIPREILKKIAFLIPNEKELNVQVDGALAVEEKVAQLYACGVKNVIATLGEKGCFLHNAETRRFFPAANDFIAVDTTGAADAFISAFAVYLSEGHGIVSSIKFATYAAGLSVTRDGVQPALAGRMALEMYADKYGAHWCG